MMDDALNLRVKSDNSMPLKEQWDWVATSRAVTNFFLILKRHSLQLPV